MMKKTSRVNIAAKATIEKLRAENKKIMPNHPNTLSRIFKHDRPIKCKDMKSSEFTILSFQIRAIYKVQNFIFVNGVLFYLRVVGVLWG